jgi:phage gpG-like protein
MIASTSLTGGAQLVKRINGLSPAMLAEVTREMRSIAVDLQRYVKDHKLSGQVLRNRTGTLRRSINQKVEVRGESVTAIVGTNVVYGAFWEYGFHGVEQVRAHQRTIDQAFGRPISPVSFAVRAHSRNVNQAARSFLRSALADMRQQITNRLRSAVARGVRK